MAFESRTGYVKNIILEFMEGKGIVDRKDIVAAIKADSEADQISEGVIAGSFKILTAQGYIVPVSRGVYTLGTAQGKAGVFDKIYRMCNKFEQDLIRACSFNVLDMNDNEKEKYKMFTDEVTGLKDDIRKHVTVMAEALGLFDETQNTEQAEQYREKITKEVESGYSEFDAIKDNNIEQTEKEKSETGQVEQDVAGGDQAEKETEQSDEIKGCTDGNDETYDGLVNFVEEAREQGILHQEEQSEQETTSEETEDQAEKQEEGEQTEEKEETVKEEDKQVVNKKKSRHKR
mgnify:CR=1 FL=1